MGNIVSNYISGAKDCTILKRSKCIGSEVDMQLWKYSNEPTMLFITVTVIPCID